MYGPICLIWFDTPRGMIDGAHSDRGHNSSTWPTSCSPPA